MNNPISFVALQQRMNHRCVFLHLTNSPKLFSILFKKLFTISKKTFQVYDGNCTCNLFHNVFQFVGRNYEDYIIIRLLYGCKIWSLTVGEENIMRKFENRVLRILFGPKEDQIIWNGGDYRMKNFVICTTQQILLSQLNQEKLDERDMKPVCSEEVHIGFMC